MSDRSCPGSPLARSRRVTLVNVRDVDLTGRRLFVRRYKDERRGYEFVPKCKIERTVPLFPAALDVLERRQDQRTNEDDTETVFVSSRRGKNGLSRPISRKRITRNFKTYRVKAELPEEFCLHSLRHTFASWLVSDGERLERLQHWMGHRSLTQTQVYAHLSPRTLIGDDVTTFDQLVIAESKQEQKIPATDAGH